MAKPPSQLADFEILHRLGAGGMAEVFLAKKRGAEGTFKLLVVKRILAAHGRSRRFRSMFVEEAQLATRLNHPNIVQVYEFSDHGDQGLLLSMEYVEGFDLGRVVSAARKEGARIPPVVAAFIVAEAAKGLHYAHERKDERGTPLDIVHRDVSPQNILVSHEGVVKIADFGIASASLFRDEPGVLKGKVGYMSPEQARRQRVDRRSDIYSLGVVLYELLCLRSPFGRLDDDALYDAVQAGRFDAPTVHVPDLPAELEAITLRALELSPDNRFQTARDMAGAIARVLLARQELVDNASVEHMLVHLFARDSPASANEEPPRTLAAVRVPRVHDGEPGKGSPNPSGRDGTLRPSDVEGGSSAGTDGPIGTAGGTANATGTRLPREVRHVAVVALRVGGFDALVEATGDAEATARFARIRGILDDIAYKRGAVLVWGGQEAAFSAFFASAVVGLLENPSRAAADAAWLAVDVHEALAGASEDLPVPLDASIGIARGVATGERDAQGHLVHHTLTEGASFLATRLSEIRPAGATVVAGGIYRLVRRDFRWSDAPVLELASDASAQASDLPRQIRPFILERPLSREERLDELRVAPNDLVGRDAERADLAAAFHKATTPSAGSLPPQDGAGRKVPRGEVIARAVVGELGIGKTALVDGFVAELGSGVTVLRTECTPARSELPFATLAELLRAVTGKGTDHEVAEVEDVVRDTLGAFGRTPAAREVAGRIAELITGKQHRRAEDDAANYRRDLVLDGLRYMLAHAAMQRPVVIVIDGLQWADSATLELIEALLEKPAALPILLLVVTRPEDRVAPFIEGLVRIELRGLSAEEQIRLVEAHLGVREGVAAVCAELVPRVAGNPFFLLEMVDALLERGTLEIVAKHHLASSPRAALPAAPTSPDLSTLDAARPITAVELELVRHDRQGDRIEALPSTLEQLLSDRLRELPAAERDVVDWLAVAGGPLLESDLLSLTRLADDEAITRLCARGLCDRKAALLDFRHPLARDVAYLALDGPTRARMHRKLGEHLATTPLARGISAAIVARHLARGESPGRAAELYIEAAAAARAVFQAQLSQRYYHKALSLLPAGDSRRLGAHEALEAIYRHLGRRRERRAHLTVLRKLAKESGQARWVALALVRTARLDLEEGYLARGLPVAQRAAEVARLAKNPALEVEGLTVLSEILRELGDVAGAIDACERGLRAAEQGGLPPRARAEVLRAKGVLLRYGGRVTEAVDAYAEAIAVFKAVGARRAEARAKNSLAFAMFVLERFEDAISVGMSSVSIDLAIGGRFQIAKTLSNIGQAYTRAGDVQRGLAYLRRARDTHERYGDQDSRADTLLCMAEALLETGDVDAAHTLVGDASALVAVTGNAYDLAHERFTRALLARAGGDSRSAVALAGESRRLAESQGLVSYHAYATAIEAVARVEIGEVHSGVLLARNALGAVETASSEYGLEIRAIACEALQTGAPSSARDAIGRAIAHAAKVRGYLRDPRLGALFVERPIIVRLSSEARAMGIVDPLARPRSLKPDSGAKAPSPSRPAPPSREESR